MSEFYQLSALSLSGKNVSMSDFAGKAVLVVNTASKCGFTPQYVELEALYKKYQDRNSSYSAFPAINLEIKSQVVSKKSQKLA